MITVACVFKTGGVYTREYVTRLKEGVEAHLDWPFQWVCLSDDPEVVTAQVGKAIEAYERTLSPGPARFDRYVAELRAAGTSTLLNDAEQRGLATFLRSGCANCHSQVHGSNHPSGTWLTR